MEYIDFITKSKVIIVDIPAFDCFQFVWFVLKKLIEAKIISSQIQKYEPTFDMIKKLKIAQARGCFQDFKTFSDLKTCGVVFYTKTHNGWENMHERHIGFYFMQKDEIIFISNHKHELEVVQENFSFQEFTNIFSNFPHCIVT